MANRNMIIGLLRGLFAVLVAMSVVISASAHASTFASHRIIASPAGDHMMGGNQQDDFANGPSPNLSASDLKVTGAKVTGAKKGHADKGSLCKMQCDFSMIAQISIPVIGTQQRALVAVSWPVAFIPGDAKADMRPPRS